MLSPRRYFTVALALWLMAFAGCDVDLFGSDAKRITKSYNLKLTSGPDLCAIEHNGDFITSDLDEIGWQQPIILCKARGSDTWNAINTQTGVRAEISQAERETNTLYRSIETHRAIGVWESLKRHKGAW